MLTYIKNNKISSGLSCLAAVLALVATIVYGATGVIKGFTDTLSPLVFVFAIAGLLLACLNVVKRIDTVETLAFVAEVLALVLFLVHNANYLVAVTRAIDVTRVSATFVVTIVFLAISACSALAAICLKEKEA